MTVYSSSNSITFISGRLSDENDGNYTSEDEEIDEPTNSPQSGPNSPPNNSSTDRPPPLLKRDTPTPGSLYRSLNLKKNYSFDFAVSSQSQNSPKYTKYGPHSTNLNLKEKNPFEGFIRLYTDSETEVETVRMDHEVAMTMKLMEECSASTASGATFNLTDSGDFESIADELERQYFDALTAEQQKVVQDNTPMLSEVDASYGSQDSESLLMQKLALCATTFDFSSAV